MFSSEKSKNEKQKDENTNYEGLDPSRQTSTSCTKERKSILKKCTSKVNESNVGVEENVKQVRIKRTSFLDEKQENENTKDEHPHLSEQTSSSCTKRRKNIPKKCIAKLESNAILEENVEQSNTKRVESIDDDEWTCKFCNEIFSSWKNLFHHERRHRFENQSNAGVEKNVKQSRVDNIAPVNDIEIEISKNDKKRKKNENTDEDSDPSRQMSPSCMKKKKKHCYNEQI